MYISLQIKNAHYYACTRMVLFLSPGMEDIEDTMYIEYELYIASFQVHRLML